MRRERSKKRFRYLETVISEKEEYGYYTAADFFEREASGGLYFVLYSLKNGKTDFAFHNRMAEQIEKTGSSTVTIRYESDGYLSGAFGKRAYELRYPVLVREEGK